METFPISTLILYIILYIWTSAFFIFLNFQRFAIFVFYFLCKLPCIFMNSLQAIIALSQILRYN